jgi:Mrp family chromosome partitioning ATPase
MTPLASAASAYPLEGYAPNSIAGRRYAHVVERILERSPQAGHVFVTSPGEGEGKTLTATNLALAFHARNISVLLAELSLVRPKLGQIFGSSPLRPGIEDVLLGQSDLFSAICVRGDNNLNLAMVRRPQESDESLAPGAHLNRLISEARQLYSWTIFDGPAIQSSTYVRTLIESMTATLMVARAGQTDRVSFSNALSKIGDLHPLVLLNDEHM